MPLIAQICMVVVTIAVLAMAVMGIRLMLQTKTLIETANRSLGQLPALMADVQRASARADELLVAFSQITRSARAGASQLEGLSTRSSAIASALLDEVERPVSQAVALIRGLRFGTRALVERWQSRSERRSNLKQGEDHVGEQRWVDDGGAVAGSGGRGRPGAAAGTNGR